MKNSKSSSENSIDPDDELEKSLEEFYDISAMKGPRDIHLGTLYNHFNDYILWRYILLVMISQQKTQLGSYRILDAGCGNARALTTFWQLGADPTACYGVDGSKTIISIAKELHQKFQLSVQLLNKLSFEDDFFDIGVCLGVLNHIQDNRDVSMIMKELCRVMKPGGLLFFSLPGENFTYNVQINESLRTFDFKNKEFEGLAQPYFDVLNVKPYALQDYGLKSISPQTFEEIERYLNNPASAKSMVAVALRAKDVSS